MLNRNSQVGLKIENTEGTEQTLSAADFRGNRKETSHRYQRGEYDRELERGTLTKQPMLPSTSLLNISWTEELVGGGPAVEAPWHKTIQALGFEALALYKGTGTASSSTLRVGELCGDGATLGASSKVGRVAHAAGNAVYFVMLTGAPFTDEDVITGFASAETLTLTAEAAAAGFGFRPQSETDAGLSPSVTVERRLGGQRHTLVGGRGTGGFALRHGQPVLINAEVTGVPIFDSGETLTPRTGSALSPEPIPAPPAVVKGVPFGLTPSGSAEYSPVATELAVSLNNTITPRPSIAQGSLGGNYESGYLSTRITDRDLTATLDPEHVLAAAGFDFIGQLHLGNVFTFRVQVGGVATPNGLVVIYAPAVQLTGDHEPGDREGVTTAPLNLKFTGDQDDELWVFHCFDPAA